MKTPHTIKLIRQTIREYDPITDTYTGGNVESKEIPCLANYISQERVFELYGDRQRKILVVRFSQEQEPFDKAEFDGLTFVPTERIDAPIKGSVRLELVKSG